MAALLESGLAALISERSQQRERVSAEPITAFGLPEAIAALAELRDRRIISVNEVRAGIGLDPLDEAEADDHRFLSSPYQPRRGEAPTGGEGRDGAN